MHLPGVHTGRAQVDSLRVRLLGRRCGDLMGRRCCHFLLLLLWGTFARRLRRWRGTSGGS